MRRVTSGRLKGLLAGALMVLLAGGLIAPRGARAGCIHPHARHGSQAGPSAHFEWLGLTGALAPTTEAPPPEDPRRPAPCSGAFCSGSPAGPPIPHAAGTFPEMRWAMNEPPFAIAGPSPSAAPDDAAGPRAVRLAFPIFHPPRPA